MPESPPKPPPVDEEDIKMNFPLFDSVVSVTLQWDDPEVTGGNLTEYYVILRAVGESGAEGSGSRRKRQADSFLDSCVLNDTNNLNITVDPPTNQTTVNASELQHL